MPLSYFLIKHQYPAPTTSLYTGRLNQHPLMELGGLGYATRPRLTPLRSAAAPFHMSNLATQAIQYAPLLGLLQPRNTECPAYLCQDAFPFDVGGTTASYVWKWNL